MYGKATATNLVVTALMLCVSSTVLASSVDPDIEFAFTTPISDRFQIVDLVSAALSPLGFEAEAVTNIRPDGFFRFTLVAPDGADVFLRGRASCVTVSIYATREGVVSDDIPAKAKHIQDALVTYLRTHIAGAVKLFQADGSAPCTHAL
jgi:hypothetical protein